LLFAKSVVCGSLCEDLRHKLAVLGGEATSNALCFLHFSSFDFINLDFLALHEVHHVDFARVVSELLVCVRVNNSPSSSVHVVTGNTLNILGQANLQWTRRQHVEGGWRTVLDDQSSFIALGDYATETIEVVQNSI